LNAKLTFVSGDCKLGHSFVKNFVAKVDISVLTRFLKIAAFKTAGCIYILFVILLKNSQLSISDYVRVVE